MIPGRRMKKMQVDEGEKREATRRASEQEGCV